MDTTRFKCLSSKVPLLWTISTEVNWRGTSTKRILLDKEVIKKLPGQECRNYMDDLCKKSLTKPTN